ncbi:hypothetical protein [Sutcliffiella horikoshii]|uniref:Uncharacterized protein n=1 Tax=Sutcliffiella horikoshii TaxID=79883 RepID=A0A5D4TCF5_9BACI|nr:hypothetical protein [Sutcliffiella horikoshii]TYS72955.1 hypothetical protein FZC75_07765 [Sutcliffiella horikoshii]
MSANYDPVCQQALEGIVLKRKQSLYEISKQSQSWIKVINYQFANVLVTGYCKYELGWLLADESGRPLGIMELGVLSEGKSKCIFK